MTEMNMVQAVNATLRQALQRDQSVMIMGEDVGVDGGVFRVTDGLQKEFGENRVVDTPVAEAGIIGSAVGLSIYGMKPICEMQFSGFIYPAFNQIVSHAARMRTRTRGKLSCPLVIRTPYSGGIRALEHHSESMEAIYGHIQGLKVVIPSTPTEAKGLLAAAIEDPDPVLFLEPKRLYRAIKEEVQEEYYTIPIGKARVVQEGSDLTIISWGAMLWITQKALEQLGKYNIELIDLRTISPLDSETIINSVKKTGRCVIVHEASKSYGPAGEIIAQINEKAILKLQAPVERVTGFDVPMPLYKNEMNYLPDEERIIAAIERVMSF